MQKASQFNKLDTHKTYGNLSVLEEGKDKQFFFCQGGLYNPLEMLLAYPSTLSYFMYYLDVLWEKQLNISMMSCSTPRRVSTNHNKLYWGFQTYCASQNNGCSLGVQVLKVRGHIHLINYIPQLNWNGLDQGDSSVWGASPQNVNKIQKHFMFFSPFDLRSIDHSSSTTQPLYDLTKAKCQTVWIKRHDAVFESLEAAFMFLSILEVSDLYKPFLHVCDWLNAALRAFISQCYREKKTSTWLPIYPGDWSKLNVTTRFSTRKCLNLCCHSRCGEIT